MPTAPKNSRPALRKGWFSLLLAVLAVVAAGTWAATVFTSRAPERLAGMQARQLPEQSSEAARETLERAPELGQASIELLVAGMADNRPEVAYRAADVLREELLGWSHARTRKGEQAMQRLASALAENLENFSPSSQQEAGALAGTILGTTPPRGTERPLETLVACETVLRATLIAQENAGDAETALLPAESAELER